MQLTADKLSYTWPVRDGKVEALSEFSAAFDSGIPQILCGPSGAGKSTLGLLLAGLMEPTKGSVRLNDVEPCAFRSRAAFVFQFPENIFFEDSIEDELKELIGSNVEAAAPYFAALGLALDEVAVLHPFHLSAGFSRMVAIALQLAREPELLILDEPTIGLDWRFHRRMCKVLREWCNPERILIFITHDLALMRELGGDSRVLYAGKQIWNGSTQTLLTQPDLLTEFGLLS